DDCGGAGQPEDGAGAAADLRPDGQPQVGHLHGGVRLQRRHVQQLRHRAGGGSHRSGRHLPAGLPAAAGDVAGFDRQAARQDPEHEAGPAPGGGDRGIGAGQAAAAAADGARRRVPGRAGPARAGPGPARAGGTGEPGVTSENLPEPAGEAAEAGQERLAEQIARTGMFGTEDTGDTSGYGGLRVRRAPLPSSPRPYGSYFDQIADRVADGLGQEGAGFDDSVEQVIVDRGELTLHVRREHLPRVAKVLRDEPSLAFEMCLGVTGVHYPWQAGRELHAVYQLLSITHNRRLRLEVSAPDADPRVPSLVSIYPTCDWHERETWDFFGIIFDGHPALTRIEMPDDWKGHPGRKDYPLGGIPVEYRGAHVPPPEERRAYQ